MKWEFEFLGEADGKKFFCIITDDGEERGMGISKRYHYYVQNRDKSFLSLSYLGLPSFKVIPTKQEASLLMDEVTRFFQGMIPYQMRVLNQ